LRDVAVALLTVSAISLPAVFVNARFNSKAGTSAFCAQRLELNTDESAVSAVPFGRRFSYRVTKSMLL
jgi:hypothetical protein